MREESYNLVLDVCREISDNADATKTLQNICHLIVDRINAKMCVIALYDADENRLIVRGAYGLYLTELETLQAHPELAMRTIKDRRIVNVPILCQVNKHEAIAKTIGLRVNNFIVMPLISGNRVIGTLSVGRQTKQALPSKLLDVLEAAAAPLTMYLQNVVGVGRASAHSIVKEAENAVSTRVATGCAETLVGRPSVSGVCAGRAVMVIGDDILKNFILEKISDRDGELKLLNHAIVMTKGALQKNCQEVKELLSEADSYIFEMHSMMLEDPTLRQRIIAKMDNGYNVRTAICLTYQEFAAEYQKVDDNYLRERLKDIEDVLLRLLTCVNELSMNGSSKNNPVIDKPVKGGSGNLILLAQELLPSQLISSQLRDICGIVCETGGTTSHAAILARALRIPMLVGVSGILSKVSSGDALLLDCHTGNCYLRPTTSLLQKYKSALAATRRRRIARNAVSSGAEVAATPNEDLKTADGEKVWLSGNIMLFSELPQLHAAGVYRIGLYRTEFMYMIRNAMPDEEEQYRVLSRLVNGADGAEVTIRVLDIGGDKPLSYVKWDDELNPSLGWRGLRFLLSNPDFLIPHLRAILRTAALGNVRIMFPMVADSTDIVKIKAIMKQAEASLRQDALPFKSPSLGIMLEVPSILMDLERVLPEIQFASIGTNDLIQYLFAVDRGNAKVNKWYRQYHPIIGRTIKQICDAFKNYPEKELSLCGEMGGSIRAIPLLLGLGLRHFSMNSGVVPGVRDYISMLSIKDCEKLASQALQAGDDVEVLNMLTDFNLKHGMKIRE